MTDKKAMTVALLAIIFGSVAQAISSYLDGRLINVALNAAAVIACSIGLWMFLLRWWRDVPSDDPMDAALEYMERLEKENAQLRKQLREALKG